MSNKVLFYLSLLLFTPIIASCSKDDKEVFNGSQIKVSSTNQNMPTKGILYYQYADCPDNHNLTELIDNKKETSFTSGHKAFWFIWKAGVRTAVNRYHLTSSTDEPSSDPKSWSFMASFDSIHWDSLDVQKNINFDNRSEKKDFSFKNEVSYNYYKLNVTANNSGQNTQIAEWSLNYSDGSDDPSIANNPFIGKADTLMTGAMKYMFGFSARDCWDNSYPRGNGYWDDDAMVWGQGAGFSGFVALREASTGTPYQDKYWKMTDRMFNSINNFITTDNNIQAYSVYPANGNDRYYDDNVWVGLSMADLYNQTQDDRFLEKAEMVWKYLMKGYDDTCGGGINWKEMNGATNTKHTCSTAPAAVLGCKLYQITKDKTYLNIAIELYSWLQKYMQDPSDYLYYDNMGPSMNPSTAKYSYNSGQPMMAACLLYKLTGNEEYLKNAQRIAESAYNKWFGEYTSPYLNDTFNILTEDNIWFASVMLRGYVELYKIDHNRKYIDAFDKSLLNAWASPCHNTSTNLLGGGCKGIDVKTNWECLEEGGFLEMISMLANLRRIGL